MKRLAISSLAISVLLMMSAAHAETIEDERQLLEETALERSKEVVIVIEHDESTDASVTESNGKPRKPGTSAPAGHTNMN